MIAADSSVVIAYLQNASSPAVIKLEEALNTFSVVLPPLVVAEILNDPRLSLEVETKILRLPQLEIRKDYWQRVGKLRAQILAKGLKARIADTQIAQSCIDHDVPLLTIDNDFRHFAQYGGLKLV